MTPPRSSPSGSTALLHSLTRALSAVSSQLHPNDLAEAIVDAFADTLHARIAVIMAMRPPRLVVLGMHGHTPAEVADFEGLLLDSDYPSARACREGDVFIEPFEVVATEYAGTSRPGARFRVMVERLEEGVSIAAGLESAGRPVGALMMHCQGERSVTTSDVGVVGALASALGMWLTHPDSGLPPEPDDVTAQLTPRQEQILRLIAAGESNAAISARLAFSSSTIKQEVGRILDLLDAPSRAKAVERARLAGLLDGEPS